MRAAIATCLTLAAAAACTTPTTTTTTGARASTSSTGTGTSSSDVAAEGAATAAPSFSLDPFYDPLVPYGDWWWSDRWGWVWSPTVAAGWRPYCAGHWLFTNAGWLWASDEPFGWATYHYGRWAWIDDAGWVWIPGRIYAPAWVVWRTAPGYIGWAPAGPFGVDVAPFSWVFVENRSFLAPSIVVVAVPAARNAAVLPATRVVHRPERVYVERGTGKRVPVHRLVDDRAAATSPRDVVVRRIPPRELGTAPLRDPRDDLPGKRARLTAPQGVVDRPLSSHDGDDDGALERRYADEKRRARDDDELRQIDEQRQRELRAAHGRRSVPRRMPVATPKRR